jgi:membrane-associated protein
MGAMVVLAALLGDNTNYWLGRRLGPAVFTKENSKLLNKKHLLKAQHFYDKYGSKTIILARFVPIVRTFAPFVAGIGRMNYFRFLLFSIIGATAWVSICLIAGYFLGSRDWVQKHFEIVVLAVIVVSLVPILVEYLKHRGAIRRRGFAVVEAVKQ